MSANRTATASPVRLHGLLMAALLLAFTLALVQPSTSAAQPEPAEEWPIPTNLSLSGGASQPLLAAVSDGRLFVIWHDIYNGYQMSSGDGEQWEPPIPVKMPFPDPDRVLKLQMLVDSEDTVYLVWIDLTYRLSYSYISFENLSVGNSWQLPLQITNNTTQFSAAVDSTGALHVAYVLSLDNPQADAGIYYTRVNRRSGPGQAFALDLSPYYRNLRRSSSGLEVDGQKQADVALEVVEEGERQTILVSWSSPVNKTLLLNRSVDGGTTWEEVQPIISPSADSLVMLPRQPILAQAGSILFLFYENAPQDITCELQYFSSDDGGRTWSEARQLYEETQSCPESLQLLSDLGREPVLISVFFGDLLFSNLSDQTWSPGRRFMELGSFTNTTTLQTVSVHYQQAAVLNDRLFIAGDEFSESGDIWVTAHEIASLFETGAQDAIGWTPASPVFIGKPGFHDMHLFADAENKLHAVWSGSESSLAGESGRTIYYTTLSQPGEPGESSPVQESDEDAFAQPTIAVDDESGRINLVWRGTTTGGLYFSWASDSRAFVANEWNLPKELPVPRQAAVSPRLVILNSSQIYVAYLIQINEMRGVYVVRSADRGDTWSQPVQAFDAASHNCEVVGQLSFAAAMNGALHLGWVCSSAPDGGASSFYTARSIDGGQVWDLTSDPVNRPALSAQVTGSVQASAHRVWKEAASGFITIVDQVSQDNGATWQEEQQVALLDTQSGPDALAVDPAGQLYLLQTVQSGEKILLKTWVWDGVDWLSLDDTVLGIGSVASITSLSAAVLPRGELAVFYAQEYLDPRTGYTLNDLSSRTVGITIPTLEPVERLPEVNPMLVETQAAPEQEPSPEAGVIDQPAPTLDPGILQEAPAPAANSMLVYGLGAALVLALVGGISIYQLRWRNH